MKRNNNEFSKAIFSLIISQIFVKILGMIYSVYLTNKHGFGDKGNAIYMSGYQIYALLLAISSIGIPNAISKLVSEKITLEDYKGADQVFKVALVVFGIVGFVFTIMLYYSSTFIATELIEIPEAKKTLKSLSPAIFFVSILSVVKGYCNGIKKIEVTAKSQTIEQFIKCLFTIFFVEIVSKITFYNTEIMSEAANFATTVAVVCSFIYVYINIQKERKNKFYINKRNYPKERIKTILKKILTISIPMTVSALLSSAGKNIDSMTVVKLLKNIIGEENAKIKYGILTSKVDMLITVPLAFNLSFATALIPEISSSLVKNDFENINEKLKISLKMACFIGIPCVFGVFTYSRQIINLLFPKSNNGFELLKLSSIIIIFGMLTQTINATLQGIGKNKTPVIALTIGIIVKFLANLVFIPLEIFYEKGAIIGNILSNISTFFIIYVVLRKNINLDFKISQIILKPILCSFIMVMFSYNIYQKMILFQFPEYISSIVGILSSIIIYMIFIVLLRYFDKNEINSLKLK